ncbi:maleylpyruvate isomerase family mycothiol-dependent enzyme [Mycobacterium haemophilum]|uniref:DinB family protein n=1 Tax=Mycobacterium haemophilum TaxID=29311 RepID=A0A0I9V4S0_9MYCO|nr:maleylpyruvate isomerase family mycothiol-dependent enzyme [Mycobacterium haemophilum]AKN15781.1 DinB family protein [Mycobacterium haemophilum DSM 44634]KLO31217.1 DinB family protein [Mycobacterium haemophilum]KLO36142.1 DinB family protein [Mycobacterium haemophilum]KLO41990.1 DinB family protein [Mycobacterium haemophilum]KLO49900.1 DinB family protein [Mycobacterium haemophilum]
MAANEAGSQSTLMSMARAERADLAAFLATLSPQQWQTPSLCAGWSVKDVVAHMISYEELGTMGLLKRFAKGRLVRANQVGVDEFAALCPQELLEFLGNHLEPQGLTAGFGGMIALVDGTIHHQDIRRALGQPRIIPADRLGRVLGLVPNNPRLGAWRRIRGLRLRATDLDWVHGRGPEITGTGEALLMAMSGRPAAIPELAGAGKATLAARLGQSH